MKRFAVPQAFVVLLTLCTALAARPVQAQASLPSLPAEASVGLALAAAYSPAGDQDFWLNAVCAWMTEGGCGYFRAHQAQMLWQAGQGAMGDWVEFIGRAAALPDGSQVWRYRIHIYANEEAVQDVFVHVVREGEAWRLNRILYGPFVKP